MRHELYKLLVYEKGSFFAPHRDTEKRDGIFATLVVSLPSRHEGGTLVVTHDGESRRIELGGGEAPYQGRYAAFYADCQHEVLPVRRGFRVCLVYNLSTARKRQPVAPRSGPAVARATRLLAQVFEDASRDKATDARLPEDAGELRAPPFAVPSRRRPPARARAPRVRGPGWSSLQGRAVTP